MRGRCLANGPECGGDNMPRTCEATRGERVVVVSSGTFMLENISARCLRPRWRSVSMATVPESCRRSTSPLSQR
eukprot:11173558-Lingulodinium_polyedra.AAC.1